VEYLDLSEDAGIVLVEGRINSALVSEFIKRIESLYRTSW